MKRLIDNLERWIRSQKSGRNGREIRMRLWHCARDLSAYDSHQVDTACHGFRAPAQEIITRLAVLDRAARDLFDALEAMPEGAGEISTKAAQWVRRPMEG